MTLSQLKQALCCPVCLDEFRQTPKILSSCGHSFCLDCMQNWYVCSGGVQTGVLRCPVCKSKTKTVRRSTTAAAATATAKTAKPPTPTPADLRKLLADNCTVEQILKSDQDTPVNFNKILACPACQFRLDDPRMLPQCRHSFCLVCLQNLYKPYLVDGREVTCIVCPVCRVAYRFQYMCSTSAEDGVPLSKDKLGSFLPFDYILACLLDTVPEKL